MRRLRIKVPRESGLRKAARTARLWSLVISSLLGSLLGNSATASIHPDTDTDRVSLESRVELVRLALDQLANLPPQEGQNRVFQWGNWPNWGNWNNWPNWGNWGNWANY